MATTASTFFPTYSAPSLAATSSRDAAQPPSAKAKSAKPSLNTSHPPASCYRNLHFIGEPQINCYRVVVGRWPSDPNAGLGRLIQMPGLGKIQRRIQRAFIANPGARLTTGDIIRWCYPRRRGPIRWQHYLSARRAAEAVAVIVGRTYPGGFIWMGKDSYQLPGDKSQPLPSDDDCE